MKLLARLRLWCRTRAGLLAFGLAALAVSFAAFNRAFGTGSLWQYLVGFIFLVITLQYIVKLARTFLRGPKSERRAS